MNSVTCGVLRVEHLCNPRGIGNRKPRLSWMNKTDVAGWTQHAYEISMTSNGATETVRLTSAEQNLVPWPFRPLESRQQGRLAVRVSDSDGIWCPWSEPASIEAGLLEPGDFSARMISPRSIAGLNDPAPVFSTSWVLHDRVVRARLYVTAHGLYVAEINGRRVGDEVLSPGWSAYDDRLQYQTFDVGDLLQPGANSIDIHVGNGWYRGNLGSPPIRDLYGDRLGLLAQLEIQYADGSVDTVVSDETWTARNSNILRDDLYNGQFTDLHEHPAHEEDPVDVVDFDVNVLVAPEAPPIRVVDEVPAVKVSLCPTGKQIVDFGQNLVGWVRFKVRNLEPGTLVTIRHAEVLENGELGVRPLRTAEATDRYVVAGSSEETLEPQFTFHGFRYAEIDGVQDLSIDDITAIVISSDLERIGWFGSSDPDLNKLHENVIWGMRGNFVGLPTDCPQRDERLGWTGDIQVFAPTASFLFNTAGFLSAWLADLAAEQNEDGSVPYIIPDIFRRDAPAAAAWGDAATVVPWTLYQRYGDVKILERQFDSMRGWVDKMDELAGDDHLWTGGFQYGDWLDPSAPPHDPAAVMTNHDVVATAHLARSAQLVANAAKVLGKSREYEKYSTLSADTRVAFVKAYVSEGGNVLSDSQTAYALALEWDLLPDDVSREQAGKRLADLVRKAGFTIGTGFVGTPLILDALTHSGEIEVAYHLLLQHECPSWLYPITMGATTIWERWDSLLPDGSINPGQMTSFNHYAFGAVADWLHRSVAGLAPADPAYRTIVVKPILGGDLTHAFARHLTPYGEASVAWELANSTFSMKVVVPTGTTASVYLPGAEAPVSVESGSHSWTVNDVEEKGFVEPRPSMTTREAMDSPELWSQIVSLAKSYKPAWTGKDMAWAASQYLDRPVEELARIVGRSRIAPEEISFSEGLQKIFAR